MVRDCPTIHVCASHDMQFSYVVSTVNTLKSFIPVNCSYTDLNLIIAFILMHSTKIITYNIKHIIIYIIILIGT